jgi:uncharacterized protein YbjT (DUF2867 family)
MMDQQTFSSSQSPAIHKIAIVAGATGLVGRELVRQLCDHDGYTEVIALVRNPAEASFTAGGAKLHVRALPTGDEILRGDEFYCALGTTIKKAGSQAAFKAVDYSLVMDLAARAKAGGVGRMVVITAVGSDPDSLFFYSRVKGEVERDLKALGLAKLDIYQPSLLLGHRTEARFAEGIATGMVPVLSLFCRGPLLKYRPIHAAELARLMIAGDPLPR